MLSQNSGNAEIWNSIQRLGINYSVNVFKQRILAACGASCQLLNHLSIVRNAILLSQDLSGDPNSAESNYNSIIQNFKKAVVNQNLLVRVRSEIRSQAMMYLATRMLVTRQWLDQKWFPYARNSGLVQVYESTDGTVVKYAGLMDLDGVLRSIVYFDTVVAHADLASANPTVGAYFQKMSASMQALPANINNENEIYEIIGQKSELLKQVSDSTNDIFGSGLLAD